MRLIDADALIKDIARLHALNDEKEIRKAYASNPHSTMTDFEDTLVSVFDAIDDAPTIEPNEDVNVLTEDDYWEQTKRVYGEQVTSKLKNPCDSLLTEDLESDKEHKSKSDLISREDAIHILACEMYTEAQSEGYEVNSIEDYIPEARAWMNDAPSALPSADRPNGGGTDD